MSTADVARANERLAELCTVEGWLAQGYSEADALRFVEGLAGLRIAEFPGRPELRWRLYARLQWSIDGTVNESTAVNTEALLATAETWPEILEKAHEYARDGNRKAEFLEHGRNRLLRGLSLTEEPLPETPEQKARSEEARHRRKRGNEEYRVGMRLHLHNQLKAQGLYDVAKAYNRKTGRLRQLFGGFTGLFDLGRGK